MIEIQTINNINYIRKDNEVYWFVNGSDRLVKIEKYGTSEGVKLAWESRERGNGKEESSNKPSDSPDVKTMEESKWEKSEFNNGEKIPTEKYPVIIDSYTYWYGDSEQTDQEAPAKTYFHNGVQIYEPSDEETRDMNRISNDTVKSAIDQVPAEIRQYIEAVQINPYAEVDMSARAQAEGNTIIIFGDQDKDMAKETSEELPYIMNHEGAHLYDQANKRISQSDAYKDAVKSDGNHVTSYSEENMKMNGVNGRNGYAEDFAEAVANYIKDKPSFVDKFPARSSIISKIIG